MQPISSTSDPDGRNLEHIKFTRLVRAVDSIGIIIIIIKVKAKRCVVV